MIKKRKINVFASAALGYFSKFIEMKIYFSTKGLPKVIATVSIIRNIFQTHISNYR